MRKTPKKPCPPQRSRKEISRGCGSSTAAPGTSREALIVINLALQKTQHICYLLAGEFWQFFPLNSDFFIHKVIIMVAIIKCSSE